QRASFLSALASTLRPEDEEFLEQCLSDRSKGVREEAAHLLSRLSSSAFSQRMAERARRVVRYVAGGGLITRTVATVEVELSTDVEDALKREGLVAKAQGKLGARGSLLSQLVGHAPLSVWNESGVAPEEWIAAAKGSDWTVALIDGWLGATERQ